ncbi:MAG: hypothetical protein WBB52_15695 [Acidimicrobiales bacterium]
MTSGDNSPDPNLALFADWVRSEERRESAARRKARDAKRLEESARALTMAKDDAAAEVKRLRSSPTATAEERAAADAAYRSALAAVVASETGTTPGWAPSHADADADQTESDDSRSDADLPADQAPPADAVGDEG